MTKDYSRLGRDYLEVGNYMECIFPVLQVRYISVNDNYDSAKVYELIRLLKDKQANGVEVTIVTWEPDAYNFGDAGFWMQLHEEIRQAGFYMKTVADSCEHFAVIDQNIVWYGNINILAKAKLEDSIMRVESKEIAGELMELTFGRVI